jgi:hypothetical protein
MDILLNLVPGQFLLTLRVLHDYDKIDIGKQINNNLEPFTVYVKTSSILKKI